MTDFNLWRYSELERTSPWATCSNFEFGSIFKVSPALSMGFDQTPPTSLPTWIIVWFFYRVTRVSLSLHEQCPFSTGLMCPHLLLGICYLNIGGTLKKSGSCVISCWSSCISLPIPTLANLSDSSPHIFFPLIMPGEASVQAIPIVAGFQSILFREIKCRRVT